MNRWIVEVKGHPCIKDDSYEYGNLEDMERFVGDNDIQVDHIKAVIHHDSITGRINVYTCIDLVSVSAVRLLLARVEEPKACRMVKRIGS